jgi:hypothetical protein
MRRHGHWVIIAANAPTAFRARHPETLLPTLKQLQRTQPDAVMRWFDGGRLWTSPAEANEARRHRGPKRPADWRPGGEHRDPRQRIELSRDEKRARFKRRQRSQYGEPPAKAGSADRRQRSVGGPNAPKGRPPAGKGRTDRQRWQHGSRDRSHRRPRGAKPRRGSE